MSYSSPSAPPVEPKQGARNQFGAFGGVFTPCILTILGVIMFMRANFVLGQAGLWQMLLILALCKSITFFTALSASAIATNMQVRGGGAYYLISRVLGPEFGGAIGLMLFLAQAVSIPFYILGFTEALVQVFPAMQDSFLAIALGTAVILFLFAYIGAGWAIRVQYAILAVLMLAVVSFLGGALGRFSTERLAENWSSGYTPLLSDAPGAGLHSFWIVFAIYFPAVTGIMAGINMSGDLHDPAKSIPRGTLWAIGTGLVIYVLLAVTSAAAYSRESLIETPYLVLRDNAFLAAGWLVTAGVFAATLSSALGSFMGAPRVLQAVARDRILPVLRPFGVGARKGDEPRRAVLLAAAMTIGVLVWSNYAEGDALNLVALVITEFFLYAYGMLNISAFIEAVGQNPSFRPRFRFFHWGTALAGAIGCMMVALVINPTQAIVAFVFLTVLVWQLKRRELQTTFGDAWRGFLYRSIRNSLARLSRMEETPKNWRPTCLVFSGNPDSREGLVTYAVWFEAGRGLVFLAEVLVGTFEEYAKRRGAALERLRDYCEEHRVQAFPVVMIDPDLQRGMEAILQGIRVGPIQPNLAVFGWSEDSEHAGRQAQLFRMARQLGMALMVIRLGDRHLTFGRRRIDIWWRGMENGGLMLLLAYLLRGNWEWADSEVRLIRLVPRQAAHDDTFADLKKLLAIARVEATPHVLVSELPVAQVVKRESEASDCVIIGFGVPEEGGSDQWHARCQSLLCNGPTTVFVCSAGAEDILA
ncbi:MAG: amino acid permease [Candidatus Hydrogenedentota bacterium]